eukprot:TRINITY_DN1473_c0_g1_i2.p1 TRINITY_DN1473_c0_g1~~TRINITY_DN1473_c0_g1_i2.p1  ORF type:complete len:1188 (-),score=304.87 TRINITY_DN1473_c0_g1_i2:40-3603(-)
MILPPSSTLPSSPPTPPLPFRSPRPRPPSPPTLPSSIGTLAPLLMWGTTGPLRREMHTTQLKEPDIDTRELFIELSSSDLDQLFLETREEIEVFYSKETITDAISELNRKQDEEERSLKVLRAINFETKSNDDLINNMKHREEMMRVQSVDKLYQNLQKFPPGSNERRELVELLRNNAFAVANSMKSKKVDSLRKSIDIFISMVEDQADDFLPTLKTGGGLKFISHLLSSHLLKDDEMYLQKFLLLIAKILSAEVNRDEFRKVHGVTRVIPFLYHKSPVIVLAATEVLLNLSIAEGNRPLIVKTGAIGQLLENTVLNDKIKYQGLYVANNLARCDIGKEAFDRKDFSRLLSILSPEKSFKGDQSVEYKNEAVIQQFDLEILHSVSSIDRNLEYLIQENAVQVLAGFFIPIYDSSYVWNYDILYRVLLVFSKILENESHRNVFLANRKNFESLEIILQKAASFHEDVVMASGIIMGILSTKGRPDPAIVERSLRQIQNLHAMFSNNSQVHNILASIYNSIFKGEYRNRILQVFELERMTRDLVNFIKDSRVKEVLVHSCSALASLSYEADVVKNVVRNKLMPTLLSLLKLAQSELTLNVSIIIAAVAKGSDTGLVEISKGIPIVVELLGDDDPQTQEQALIVVDALLSAKGGDSNIQAFLRAEGDRPLMDCLISPNDKVQFLALKIVKLLSTTTEHREILRDAGIEECFNQLHKTILLGEEPGRLYLKLREEFNQDGTGKVDVQRLRVYWLKIIYNTSIKIVPIRETLTFRELIFVIKNEFSVDEWDRITVRSGTDEMEVSDQRTLQWILNQLAKNKPIQVEVQPKCTDANKLDILLQRLTHKQLRVLLKLALDQEAELRDKIGQYIISNRGFRQNAKEERIQREPYGGVAEEQEEKKKTVDASPEIVTNTSINNPVAAPSAPPPPPPPTGGKSGSDARFKAASKGDLMTDIKNALRAGGNLRRTPGMNEKERKAKGLFREKEADDQAVLKGEEAESGNDIWNRDISTYIDYVKKILTIDYHMARILFHLIRKTLITFDAALQMMDLKETVNHETLARIMLDLGFYVEYSIYSHKEEEEFQEKTPDKVDWKEYKSIICPFNFPTTTILKLIRAFLKTNGINRQGEPLREDVKTLKATHRENAKSIEAATQNYWTRSNRDGQQQTVGDIGVVQGYWKKKDQITVGKLWD